MTRRRLTPDENDVRRAIADRIIASGGNMKTFARAAGLTPVGALGWLKKHEPIRHQLLTVKSHRKMTAHQALVRLLLIKSVKGIPGAEERIARALGVTAPAFSAFRRRWAPDDIDAAISDLMPHDAEAA